MGQFVYFCAGTSVEVLPGKRIEAVLLNVPHNGKDDADIKKSRNLIEFSQAKLVMLDSGGYQLLVNQEEGKEIIYDEKGAILQPGKINLTPWHVIRAAIGIRPDIMVALDFPIRKILEKEKQEIEFRFKLGFNVDWSIKTAELRQQYCAGIKLFLPVQCYTLEHLDLFLRLIGNVSFDGLSMPVRNLSLAEVALFLIRFYQMGIRQVHLLGVASFFVIALATYLSRHLLDWLSLDATTWRQKAQFSGYLNPYDLSSESIGEDVLIDENIKMDCNCPWCSGRTFTYIKNLPYTEKTDFLRCHNNWTTEKISRELYQNAGTLGSFKTYLQRASSHPEKVDQLIKILGALEICKDLDISAVQEVLGTQL